MTCFFPWPGGSLLGWAGTILLTEVAICGPQFRILHGSSVFPLWIAQCSLTVLLPPETVTKVTGSREAATHPPCVSPGSKGKGELLALIFLTHQYSHLNQSPFLS